MVLEGAGDVFALIGLAVAFAGAVMLIIAGRRAERALAHLALGAPSAMWRGNQPVRPPEDAAERAMPRFTLALWGVGLLAVGFGLQIGGLLLP